jgi:Ca2+-binding RTX toxin-like protein
MTTRIRRAVTAAALTAASLTGAVALATPAFAADTVSVSFGNLILSGGPEANSLRFAPVGNLVEVRELNSTTMTAGPGCIQIDTRVVHCRGVQNINANGRGGVDVLDNKTTLPSVLNGDTDSDLLIGGPRNDQLIGGPGTDNANGGPGQDICNAEGETNCELD